RRNVPHAAALYKGLPWIPILTLLLLFQLGIAISAPGQELSASVQIDRSRITGTSLEYLDDFAQEIESYLNGYDWIDANFQPRERIDLQLQITLLSVDENFNFQASVVVLSRRPIYNTMNQTTLFLYNDESWAFNYTPNRQLIHDEFQFDAIATFLDFYAYLVLGYDFDSFSELGGNPYFLEAENMVSLGQTTSSPGWARAADSRRSRARLIVDLLSGNYEGLRRAFYIYHRLGLDQFADDPPAAREEVLRALELIRDTRRTTTGTLLFDTFFNAKYRELVSVFEDAPSEVRLEAYNLLREVDQSHLTTYGRLR
ncbi:MAG: DUF4835 family protein, partial [Balneolaceae bacterium]|nr:DUF4835 family protein [Balneolaceae bacterium]